MKKTAKETYWGLIVLGILLMLGNTILRGEEKKSEEDRFVDRLFSKMSLEEKIGQLNMPNIEGAVITGPVRETNTGEEIRKNEVGALLNLQDSKKIREIQSLAVKSSRFGIPLLFGMDVIHGYKTIFPIPLALASTWDMGAIERAARISAIEASSRGICWTFSPMVDITKDARWGRIAEGAGEDSYLGGEVAKAYVRGYQEDLKSNTDILACVKHYALYGAPDGGKDYNTVDMSRQRMFNDYLWPYQAAVEAGAGSVMSAFNEVDGIPCGANPWLLTDLLRKQWGFKGFVVSDWDAVHELEVHGIGENLQEVSALALKAGLDMDMASEGFVKTLKKSYEEGKISKEEIDRACGRVLRAKYKLGLFKDPYKYCKEEGRKEIFTPEHREAAREIAGESFVLLKNEKHVLPLKGVRRIAVIGPLADNRANMLGPWTVSADLNTSVSVLEGLKAAVGDKAEILYAKGSNLEYDKAVEARECREKEIVWDSRTADTMEVEAMEIAGQSDVIVAVMGESSEMSGESSSRAHLGIPGAQKALLKKLVSLGKPVVLVLFSGRPLALKWESEHVDAILEAWFPGTEAGNAIADVLFGKVNPSGKTTITYPRSVGEEPMSYKYKNTGRPPEAGHPYEKYRTAYIDEDYEPLYPFGYGLSYSQFEYGDLQLSKKEMKKGESLEAKITVSNKSNVDGNEVVEMYIRDKVGSVTRLVKELKGFKRIYLKAGESKEVNFKIDEDMLKFYNYQIERVSEPGKFEVMIGGNSRDVKTDSFILR